MEYKIELDNGLKIILNKEQIMKVHQYFEKQCLLEYVGNNNTDWSDEKIEFVTERAFDILKEVIIVIMNIMRLTVLLRNGRCLSMEKNTELKWML